MFNYNTVKNISSNALNQLIKSGFGKTVVYKKYTGNTFDPSIGSNVVTYDEYSINTITEVVAMEIGGASSVLKAIGYNAGEQLYYIPYNELPRSPNDDDILKDKILDEGKERKIKKAIPIFDILVIIQV